MCTLSWIDTGSTCEVFFNRDEQRTRKKAQDMALFESAAYPVDPEGGGTWISANADGLAFALLNFYQGAMPKGALVSRGRIITQLANSASVNEAKAIFDALDLSCFAPFSLCVLTREIKQMWRWDGVKLEVLNNITSPITSSSVEFEQVQQSRFARYQALAPTKSEALFQYHTEHAPDKGFKSVCMHREDAKSVSLTHIVMAPTGAALRYHNGSPCALKTHAELLACKPIMLNTGYIQTPSEKIPA